MFRSEDIGFYSGKCYQQRETNLYPVVITSSFYLLLGFGYIWIQANHNAFFVHLKNLEHRRQIATKFSS